MELGSCQDGSHRSGGRNFYIYGEPARSTLSTAYATDSWLGMLCDIVCDEPVPKVATSALALRVSADLAIPGIKVYVVAYIRDAHLYERSRFYWHVDPLSCGGLLAGGSLPATFREFLAPRPRPLPTS